MAFERIIKAALSETRSKFALAEALAIEIPPRRSGPSDDNIISSYLAKAIQAISDAGGEPRAVLTMADYRKTALWVQGVNAPNFRWVKGTSFTAHNEARKVGLSYNKFVAMPLKTTDAIRAKAGKAGTDGPPSKIIETWTPAQRVETVRELVKDAAVARAVIADRETNVNLAKARQDFDQGIQDHADVRHPERVGHRHASQHQEIIYWLTQVRKRAFENIQTVMDLRLSKSQREEGQELAEEVTIAVSRLKAAYSGTIDQELADAIEQWRNE